MVAPIDKLRRSLSRRGVVAPIDRLRGIADRVVVSPVDRGRKALGLVGEDGLRRQFWRGVIAPIDRGLIRNLHRVRVVPRTR